MKIIKFTAENVKRLRAVEITPDGTVQVITGKNAAGKSSVLDAIWLALGGGAASKSTTKPIRAGHDNAHVRLDLGDLVVTRTWAGDKTTLKVESADGAKYSSPQGVLDSLVGRLSFDPLEFTRLGGREQVAALLDLVDLDVDLDQLAADRKTRYEQRTEIGREVKALEGQIFGFGEPIEGVPDVEVSVSELLAQFRQADEANRTYQTTVRDQAREAGRVASLKSQLAAAEQNLAFAQSLLDALPEVPDLDAIQARIDSAEDVNEHVRANAARAQIVSRLEHAKGSYKAFSDSIEAIDQAKAEALAGATFPVKGLGFDDDGVTYQGVPFSQASSAEQIRVSLAMAMSLNPKLRVIRILDGSLLDADNMALIAGMAAAGDYQVWIERVSDDSGVGVVIEDGQVTS
jgi:ATPase subunit of ABC transporter with duplicated ATPase domains